MTLTEGDVKVSAIADAPERAGVFRLNVTPAKDGAGRIVIDVATDAGTEHFTVQVTNGLRDGDRVVVRGTDKMSRQ